MHISEFDYHLPPELIAQYPSGERANSRLLILGADAKALNREDAGAPPGDGPWETRFFDVVRFLRPGDLMVFNDTRVIPARLFGQKSTGGRVEILLERILDGQRILAQIRASKPPRPGMMIRVLSSEAMDRGPFPDSEKRGEEDDVADSLEVRGRKGDFFVLQTVGGREVEALLKRRGRIPLPPYIRRGAETFDAARYQTVYARRDGAVAAPTAGLHFDQELLSALRAKGVESAFVTLHVGAGTFSPVRVEHVETHKMHTEYLEVSEEVCARVRRTRQRGGRIVAVGTTSVRALETACRNAGREDGGDEGRDEGQSGGIRPFRGETDIFIYPGFDFRCVDILITNFHLPGSTLLMLVSAFAGRERILNAYRYAVERRFRFFSYGDAMLIFR
uniref:S-adenosylmethionine:tRNA ribosyltransferase-isomerase n=1 Tax=Candidatus Kentrum sp. DK TaxID=2126562 RepID=A0A450SEU8_9GAMM|nr:MAG: S-adenosylmethionine:tRNA ribosyltransferase-isomerase [Candidatus Kentron sp. DK]